MSQLDIQGASFGLQLPGHVSDGARARMRDGVPENTRRAYARWTARWVAFCDEHGVCPLPATEETLAEWVNALADDGLSRSSIAQSVSAIRKAHDLAGHADQPPLRAASAVLRGYTRQRSRRGLRARQAPPATVPVLRAMIGTLDPANRPGDARDHLLLVLGFGMFARRSELAGVDRSDVSEDQYGLTVWVREAKTDKTGEGQTARVIRHAHPLLDPVTVLRHWTDVLDEQGINNGPLLRQVDRHGRIGDAMSGDAVSDIVRRVAVAADVSRASDYTGHSLRAGAATAALSSGATLESVCTAGRWVSGSQAVAKYSRPIDEWRDHPLRNIGLGT